MNKPFDHKRNDAIKIDHLAFSVPITEFKHFDNAPTNRNIKWAKIPKRNWSKIKDLSVREQLMADWQAQYRSVMFERFVQFAREIMGIRVSNMRDRGLHGYENSAKLLALKSPVDLGFVGIGGNNDTLYVQLSGEGCKHVFAKTSPFILHHWLCKVLSIKKLNRIDLCYDDFDGNYSTQYAEIAYYDDAFKNPNGGRLPQIDPRRPMVGNKLIGDTVYIGSRQSNIFWRIYDKALEQCAPAGTVWNRSEVELKRCTSDVLENPARAFAGLNRFSSSVNLEHGLSFRSLVKQTTLDFNARIRWAKRQCGRTLSDVLETFGGDIYAAFGALCDERGGKFGLPDTQAMILNHHYLEVQNAT